MYCHVLAGCIPTHMNIYVSVRCFNSQCFMYVHLSMYYQFSKFDECLMVQRLGFCNLFFIKNVYLLHYTSLFSSHGFCIHWLFGDAFLASWSVELFYHIKKTFCIHVFINIITCYC